MFRGSPTTRFLNREAWRLRTLSIDTFARRHGMVSTIIVDECSVAVGNIVRHEYVLAASRMKCHSSFSEN